MTVKNKEVILRGIGISPGIVIGKVRLLDRKKLEAEERSITSGEVEMESRRLLDAIEKSKQQLLKVKNAVFGEEKKDHLYIIDAHLMMLEDKMLVEDTIRNIRREKVNAEWALAMVVDELKKIFDNIEDAYMRERSGDISYVGNTILRNLLGETEEKISKIDEKVVVVAHDLSPADTVQMNKKSVIGFATDIGGKTSHTAIIARALEIPAVGGLEEITARVVTGDHIIVDGLSGKVVISPGEELFRDYLNRQQRYHYIEKEIHKYADLPAETPDGRRLHIAGNIEIMEEIPSLLSNGGEGVGLYRTEFLYMSRRTSPGEDEQYEVYRQVIKQVSPRPVTIRTLDVGMDKLLPYFDHPLELNPAMGLRSIRFCFKERDVFKTQLRAILRASANGKVRVMFPMISGVDEVRMAKAILNEAKAELAEAGIPFDEKVETGIMMEVPSSAMIADILAKEVDFFSIGTNDLIQYSLAIDRVNEHVAYLYEPLHPAILRMVKNIVQAGQEAGIRVGMCGEMAGDPVYSLVLLGMGLDELSMSAFSIPRVKQVLRNISYTDAREITEKVFTFSTAADIRSYLSSEIKSRFSGELWEEFDMAG